MKFLKLLAEQTAKENSERYADDEDYQDWIDYQANMECDRLREE